MRPQIVRRSRMKGAMLIWFAEGGFGRPFRLLDYRGAGSNSARYLTALMRGVIVIQSARCKPFGPALSGEIRKPPAAFVPF